MSSSPPARPADPGHVWFLPPRWFAIDDTDRLRLLDGFGGDELELQGTLREALLKGERPPALSSLGALADSDPILAKLSGALEHGPLRPLTRAHLLRGSGYGQLFIELTARCNERCVHCYAQSSPEREERLDPAMLESALQDAAALRFHTVQFTGGDPLISELCVPGVERAAELGIERIEIYTNGLALSAALLERIRSHRVDFAFSFYSHDPATHDAITRTHDSQRRTLAAIDRVIAAGLSARVSVIVMDQNRDHLEPTVALLQAHGVARERIGMDVQRSVGRGLMTIRPKESGIAQALGGHRAADLEHFSGRAAVAYDGTVFPCIFSRALPLGHLGERRLREILEDDRPLTLDLPRMLAEYGAREAQLACWECRLRGALLTTGDHSHEPATSLR